MLTSLRSSTACESSQWKTVVQPCVASTHLPTYKIIGAAPRPRTSEDDLPVKSVLRRNKMLPAFHWTSPSSSPCSGSPSSLRRMATLNGARRTTPITRENLSMISMLSAREEDLDAPFSSPVPSPARIGRTGSDMSESSAGSHSDLPCIAEEEED